MNSIQYVPISVFLILLISIICVFPPQTVHSESYLSKFGTFGSGDGQFNNPEGIDLDSSGNIYVADTSNNRIQKFNSAGVFQLKFGTSGSGNGQFSSPIGLAVDSSGNIYVADTSNNRIQKFNSAGVFQLKFGTSGSGNGQFSSPIGLAVDSSGNIYVADTSNNRIQKFNSAGVFQLKFGTFGSGNGQFSSPIGISVDSSGNIYVADANNHRIQKFNSAGVFQLKFGTFGSVDNQFDSPRDISVDSSGNIYVADTSNNRIQKFNSAGVFQLKFGTSGSGNGQFSSPIGLAVDSSGNIYVADANNHRIQKFGILADGSTVSGTIFADSDGDGIQDIGESGIPGRTVILVDGVGTRLSDHITNATGGYTFTGVAPGTLLVQTAPVPANHLPSTGFNSWARPTVMVNSTITINFPLTPIAPSNMAVVNGTVFEDINNDGIKNGNDTGLEGVQVFVVDFLTLTQTSILTNANGTYTATGILPDVVLVQAAPIPAGHLPHTTTYSYQTLAQGSTTTVDFALRPVVPAETGTITFDVFNDININGIKDLGETEVSGARVFTFELLTAQADVQFTNSTGSSTHSGLIPDVVLAQINADPFYMPSGFSGITTANGGFEYVPVTPGSTTLVKIGLH